MTKETLKTVVDKLIGQVYPIGDHNVDILRGCNLDLMMDLNDHLMRQISTVAQYSTQPEVSMRAVGNKAKDHLGSMSEWCDVTHLD